MASTRKPSTGESTVDSHTSPDDWNWDTVAEEAPTKVVMDIGDVFIGTYKGVKHIVPENGEDEFDIQLFRDRDNVLCSLGNGYKLSRALVNVKPDDIVRITRTADVDTGAPAPMKDYRVDVKRA